MKTLLLALTVLAGSAFASEQTKPNILLIYSDDHGWADLGAQGVDKDIRTPNLDALAGDGVRFARGYVSAPQCVPSRAGVITGRYQQKFGVEDNGKGPLPLEELTIAERLKPAGYVTGQVGKWHLSLVGDKKQGDKSSRVSKEHMPGKQGFDEYWCGEIRQFVASHDLQGQPFPDAPHLVKDERFRVDVQTEAALSFLDRRAADPGKPWFLYLAWFAPHVPLESPEPWFSKTPENLPLERRQALAMIAAMDDGLGRIRAKLKEMGVEKNTLIFFIGDNGAPLHKGAWDGSLNLPLIGEKGMLSDGGTRTPFVAAWPGTLPAGKVFDQPVINLDVAATAVALAGVPSDDKLDGVNLLPFLKGEKSTAPHETLYWRWRSQAAVLEFPWKLIRLGPTERFLFDVTTPDGETKNLIAEHPEIAERLEAKLKTWSDTLKPPGLPTETVEADQSFFEDHGVLPKDAAAPTAGPQGWMVRNGELTTNNGALQIVAGDDAPFLTRNKLDLPGPVTATLRLRATHGGKTTFTWRTDQQDNFVSDKSAAFNWPTSSEWQEIKVVLPVEGNLIHLRIMPPKGTTGLEVQSIELQGKDGKAQSWRFDANR